jgi:Taurine catabolism dioxygenase TauD, TfdA family
VQPSPTELFQPDGGLGVATEAGCPPTVEAPAAASMSRALSWLTGARDAVRAALDAYGVLFVRGLPMRTERDFADLRDVLVRERTGYREKATPRSDFGDDVFSSTDLPPAQSIRPHNENSYTLTFPGIVLFGCLTAPESGGATPVADCRAVLEAVPRDLVDRFRATGWKLLRNYGEHMSLGWRTAFGTDSPAEVARYCADHLISCRWGADGETLHTEQTRSATVHHPRTGHEVWFNHVAFWNEWSLDPDIRDVLLDELGPGGLPFNTAFGDGTPVEAQGVAQLNEAYDKALVRRRWEPGDLMIVDNVRTAHGRDPFRGARRIVVAMGEPVALADCRPTVDPS